MSDTRNFIIAIALSVTILMAWQFFYEKPKQEEALRVAQQRQQTVAKQEEAMKQQLIESGASIQGTLDRHDVINAHPRIKISTPKLHGSIALKGARFDDITLANYKRSTAPHAADVVLLSPSQTKNAYFAQFNWIDPTNSITLPKSDTVWTADQDVLTDNQPVTLRWDNGEDLIFTIKISVDKDYMFRVEQSVQNNRTDAISILPYGLLNRVWDDEGHENFAILHEGMIGVFDDTLKEVGYDDLIDEKRKSFKETSGWLGVSDKYWLTAIIPDATATPFSANFSYAGSGGKDKFQADFLGKPMTVAPNTTTVNLSHFFAGAKEVILLDRYSEELGIPLFDRAVDFGFLYFITKPLFMALKFFHSLLGNFGLAILLLTVCVKLIMFPLANKSYVSIHQMKKLQPEILRLKEQYTDNKTQLNQEVMQFYKREKVNPLSGCLPLIIQLPVFFALYKVLFITIEMRHAPFYGWIDDLSAPDPTTIFNLFGLIPWDPPAILMIGAWSIIMGITMILQQQMNPAPADPTQAMVMKILPFIFIFIFASFPVGLIIYWAWNNSLSLLQQWIITRRLSTKS